MIQATEKPSWRPIRLSLAVWAILLAGCATIPVQEMSDARQAIDAAARTGGDQKAATQMQDARAALNNAEFALKNMQYDKARQLAQEARTKAIEAQRVSESGPAGTP